jgi:RecA-family ATPase
MTLEAFADEESVFPVMRAAEIPLEEAPRRWLIEGLWGAASVGIVGGTPKSLKTWASLEMAVSVATGTPCLDRYPVLEQGRVLLYLAEDSLPMIKERIDALANHRALTIDALDVYVITTPPHEDGAEPEATDARTRSVDPVA